ncbi:MAG: hypothetical protein ACYDBB_24030 [Armatimonadota bacterium]
MSEQIQDQPIHQRNQEESPLWIVVLLGVTLILVILGISVHYNVPVDVEMRSNPQWNTLLGVIATLGIFTILYKENPIFRFLEHIFIGLATGFGVVFVWVRFIEPRWFTPLMPQSVIPANAKLGLPGGQGEWWMIFALLIGLLFFTVYFPKLAWMNRFAFGIFMGWAAGAAFQMFIGLIGPQIVAAFRPPITTYDPDPTIPAGLAADKFFHLNVWWHPLAFISMIVLLCVMAYFFFSVEHKNKLVRQPAIAGRYLLMITLGAIFGTTVMGRLSLLIARLDFLIFAFKDFGTWVSQLFH